MKHSLLRPIPLLLFVATIGILLLAVSNARVIADQLHSWKLLPQPETLTELSFTHIQDIPVSYTPGTSQTIDFTVRNKEHRTIAYTYRVEQISQVTSQGIILANGTFTLPHDRSHRQQSLVTLGDLQRSQIRVTLQPTNESINYWINKE